MRSIDNSLTSVETRLQLLEYRSIDREARNRHGGDTNTAVFVFDRGDASTSGIRPNETVFERVVRSSREEFCMTCIDCG